MAAAEVNGKDKKTVLSQSECVRITGNSLDSSADASVDEAQDQWIFSLEELYKMAIQFYKDKDGTADVQMTYADRLRLAALTKQVSYGKYRANTSADVGLLDVVGNDRRQVWQSLGDMPKVQAMKEFTRMLMALSSSFLPHIKALQAEREQAERLKQEEENERRRLEAEAEERKQQIALEEEKKLKSEQLEHQIREALLQQTELQFRQYAKQQFPDNMKQQEELVVQLQEQHFEQYMEHIHSQLVIHQRQQYAQLHSLANGGRPDPLPPTFLSEDQQQLVEFQTEASTAYLESLTLNGENELMSKPAPPGTIISIGMQKDGEVSKGDGSETAEDKGNEDPLLDARKRKFEVPLSDETGEEDQESDIDDQESDYFFLNTLPPLIPALIWTRKDIREFKDSIRKTPESVLRVSSLSTATVRVPTHRKGASMFWEFATDSYDIGFGVYFEWTIDPPTQVSVQVSESSDEEDLDEEYPEGSEAGMVKGDIEKGARAKKDNGPPTDEIVQVYRRDCHEEVYCGSHMYPGRGVYLLKFDNSYSLWRSKTVYYRVFYSK